MVTHARTVVAAVVALMMTTAAAPATLDPNMTAAATLPASLLPDMTDALALVITVAPHPATAAPRPASFDPDEAGACRRNDDHARRRWFLFDLDNGHRRATHVTMGANDAARAERHRSDQCSATECVLERHI